MRGRHIEGDRAIWRGYLMRGGAAEAVEGVVVAT
jgi:hypothetical protein